jgi:membrane protein implicated in regulation of membrane protease activity
MEPVLHLSAKAAAVHMPRTRARRCPYEACRHRKRLGTKLQPALSQRQITRMAKRGVALRGRTLVALVLSAFVLVALAIVWRRTIGIGQAETLARLDVRRTELEGERARLEGEVRDASSRQSLGVAAESRLGMHIPADKQVVILPRAGRHESP